MGVKTSENSERPQNKTAGQGRIATALDTSHLIDMQEVTGSNPVSPTSVRSKSEKARSGYCSKTTAKQSGRVFRPHICFSETYAFLF